MVFIITGNAFAQSTMPEFEALYGKSPEYLFFKNGKMKLMHFYSDGIVLEKQYDFIIVNDRIQFEKDGKIEFHDRGQIYESIEYNGIVLQRIQNFMMLYSSLGYNEYDIASKFRDYNITNADVLNRWDFCKYIDVKNNLSDPFILLQQYWTNTFEQRNSLKKAENKKPVEQHQESATIRTSLELQEQFDDSVRENTFPCFIGYLTDDKIQIKTFEAFIIDKKDDGELKVDWVNENKKTVNFTTEISNYKHRLKKIKDIKMQQELRDKIEELMRNKTKGIYYLSFDVYEGQEELYKGVFRDAKKIDIKEFYKGTYDNPEEKYLSNQISYSVICDSCNVRYVDKDGKHVECVFNMNTLWKYDFTSYTGSSTTHSGQYVYITAQNKNVGGSVIVKIIRDGVIWKESTNSGEMAITVVSGYLP